MDMRLSKGDKTKYLPKMNLKNHNHNQNSYKKTMSCWNIRKYIKHKGRLTVRQTDSLKETLR